MGLSVVLVLSLVCWWLFVVVGLFSVVVHLSVGGCWLCFLFVVIFVLFVDGLSSW